uniref:hypothetical protein n=1 Tax=unclassified Streptomyces TaxID=2593676 RepID=UPI003F498634
MRAPAKASRCALVLVVLALLLPSAASASAAPRTAAPAGVAAAAPAVAHTSGVVTAVPARARADGGGIWGQVVCNVLLAPVLTPGGSMPACAAGKIVLPAAKKAVDEALQNTIVKPMADGMAEFNAQLLKIGLAWWLMTPSVQVKDSGVTHQETGKTPDGTTMTFSLQALCLGVGEVIAVLLVMFQGIRTMVRRKGTPLAEAVQGLVVHVLVCLLGITVIDSLLIGSDQLSSAILNVAFHGDGKLTERMVAMLVPAGFNPMALLVMGVLVLLVTLVQWVLLFLRQAAIPIQSLLLPIAGSGQVGGEKTRQWLPRLYSSILIVIAYKPCAALIISAGFVEMANGNGLIDWLRGMVTLILSVVALKALMGLFAPIGASIAGATSGGFAGALTGVGAMMGLGGRGGGGGGGGAEPASAVQHASAMSKAGPAAGGAAGAHPALAAAQAGIGAAQAAKSAAAGAMSGEDGAGVPQQQGNSKTGQQGQDAQGARQNNGQGQGGPDGSAGATGGTATPAPGAASTAANAHTGVNVALRAAEAGGQAAKGAGDTMSEGSKQ